MNFWEEFIINAAVGILHGVKFNPAKVPAFKEALVLIVTTCCEILGVQPPVIP